MTKTEIEDYKGHTIFYDEDSDKFLCDISVEDQVKNSVRKSLKAVRTDIDQFLRDNLNFKPFKFIKDGWREIIIAEVKAIRSDRKAIVKESKYSQSHYKKSDFDETFEYDTEWMEKYNNLISEFSALEKDHRTKLDTLKKELKKLDVSHLNLI